MYTGCQSWENVDRSFCFICILSCFISSPASHRTACSGTSLLTILPQSHLSHIQATWLSSSPPVPLPSPFPAPFFPHPTPPTLMHLLIPSFKIKEPGYRKRVGKAGKRLNKEQMLICHEEGKKGWLPSQTSSFYLWRCSVCPQMKVRERDLFWLRA